MTDQHDDLGRYFLPEPEGTEQPPACTCSRWDPEGLRQAGTHFSRCPVAVHSMQGSYRLPERGSRYAKPSDPWPEIPDAPERERGYREHALSKPLLDDDEERSKLAATAIYQVLREALPLASLDSLLRATKRLVARLKEPLDA